MGNFLFGKSKSRQTIRGSMSSNYSADAKSRTKNRDAGCYDSSQNSSLKQLPKVHNDSVLCLASARKSCCLSGGTDNFVLLTDINSGEVVQKWTGHERDVTKVVYGEAAELYISSSRDRSICVWRFGENSPHRQCIGHDLVVTGIALNSDNSLLCSGSRDNTIRLWDLATGKSLRTNSLAQNLITHLCWVQRLNAVAQSGEDKEFKLWDARTLNVVAVFPRKQYIQTYCDVSEDDNYCVTSSNGFGGNGCEASLWDLRMNRLVHEYKGHHETISCCRFLPLAITGSRNVIATSSNDCSVRIWDRDTTECLDALTMSGSGPLTSIAAFEDKRLCVSSFNMGIQLLKLSHPPKGTLSLTRVAEF